VGLWDDLAVLWWDIASGAKSEKHTILERQCVITARIHGLCAPIITYNILRCLKNLTLAHDNTGPINAGLSIMLLLVQKPIEATATRDKNQQWDDVLNGQVNPSIDDAASLYCAPPITTIDSWNHAEGTISGMLCLLIACLKEDHPVCRPFLAFFHWLTLPDICARFDERSRKVDH